MKGGRAARLAVANSATIASSSPGVDSPRPNILAPMDIRYAHSGSVDIAYRVLGQGPITLLYVAGSFSNLEVMWEHPDYRRFCERLASFTQLVLFDKRGMGLSDRVEIATLEERMDDVRAVLDANNTERAALLGVSEGGPMSMLFAATYPQRTQALVLCGAEVKEEITDDWPWGEWTRADFESSVAELPQRWGKGAATSLHVPDAADPDFQRRWWARVQIQSATPRVATAFQRMAFDIDVRHVVSAVTVPTLIIHRVADKICNVENGRFLAANIAGARYVELPGENHSPYAGGGGEIADEIQEFLTGFREPAEPDRVLLTILFTDIVDSTAHARQFGDRRWRELLDRHHEVVRRELKRFRGREVDTAGDGFFAVFDGPARAIRCARSLVAGIREIGLEIRAGLHTGEVELVNGQVRGIAVHIGARVAALAKPGEIVVSRTVKDLIAGSGIELAEHGTHAFKGVDGSWDVYAVAKMPIDAQ
jgi:class 3 adenylate cyclase/pimeloyl-ACP methyl ester carboxylesterase